MVVNQKTSRNISLMLHPTEQTPAAVYSQSKGRKGYVNCKWIKVVWSRFNKKSAMNSSIVFIALAVPTKTEYSSSKKGNRLLKCCGGLPSHLNETHFFLLRNALNKFSPCL